MKLKENKRIKYIAVFKNVVVHDRETEETYETKMLGVDYMERGHKYSSVYDIYKGKDISDEKKYDIFLKEKNIFGFGGTKVTPIYCEDGWEGNDE